MIINRLGKYRNHSNNKQDTALRYLKNVDQHKFNSIKCCTNNNKHYINVGTMLYQQ
jgi:hypothetical protein